MLVTAVSPTARLRSLIDQTLRDRPTLVNRVQGMYALVVMVVSYWRGHAVAREARVILDGVQLERKLTTEPRWRLLPHDWEQRFAALELSAKSALDGCSTRGFPVASAIDGESFDPSEADDTEETAEGVFSLRGIRLVMTSQMREMSGRILAIRDQLRAAADELCDTESALGYESIKTFLTRQADGNKDALAAALTCVPTPEVLRSKFNIRLGRLPVGAYDSQDESAIELAVYNLEHMIKGPRYRLAQALITLAVNLVSRDDSGDLIHREKRTVKTNTIYALTREMRAFRSFAEVQDDRLRDQVDALESHVESLGVDANDVAAALRKNEDKAMDLAVELYQIAAEATDVNRMMAAAEQLLSTI